jgi:O-antigen/teichoic acid export membrane protein
VQLLTIVRRNVSSKVCGEVLSRGIFLLFFFYLGRKLGTASFGDLNLALSTTYILGVLFLDPGLNLSAIRLLIERESESAIIASTVLCLKLVLFVPVVVSVWGLNRALGERLPTFSFMSIASLYIWFTAVFDYLASVTNAYHRMDLEAVFKIVGRILVVLFGLLGLRIGGGTGVLWAMSLGTCIACGFALIIVRTRLLSMSVAWRWDIARMVLLAGLPIAGTLIVGTIYLKWDLLVLSYFHIGRQEIGWYAGAFKIVEAFSAFPSMLGAALFPLVLQLRIEDPAALDRLLVASTKLVLAISLPVAGTISLFSRQIIGLVYGSSYLPGASVLGILIWCLVPIFLYFYLMFVNIAAGHAKRNLIAGCVALVAGLTANSFLVPRLGYVGAAWSALAANSSFALLATWKVCTVFRRAGILQVVSRFFASGLLLVSIGLYAPVSLPIRYAIGMTVYILALMTFGAMGRADVALFLRMVRNRPNSKTDPGPASDYLRLCQRSELSEMMESEHPVL